MLFMLEEYVDIIDTMHVMYCLHGKHSFITDSVKTPQHWRHSSTSDTCFFSVSPHPKAHLFDAALKRFLTCIAPVAPHAIGAIQCGLTDDDELYFIENNVRPPTAMFSQLPNFIPCLREDVSGASFSEDRVDARPPNEETFKIAIALMHRDDEIPVAVERLSCLTHAEYAPFSLRECEGRLVSHRRSFPSILIFHAKSPTDVMQRIQSTRDFVYASGDFLGIDLGRIEQTIGPVDPITA